MKLINQNVEEWHCGYTLPEIWSHIAKCARVCYQSEHCNNEETDEEFVKRVILRNYSLEEIGESRELQLKLHLSVLEHGTVYLDIPYEEDTREGIIFFSHNKYSKLAYSNDLDCYITTNMRVIVEQNLTKYLKYICSPTRFHSLRTTFNITTDIGVARELARHRTHSISEESTRYCNYSKDKFGNELTFIIPSWCSNRDEAHIVPDKYDVDWNDKLIEDFGNEQGRLYIGLALAENAYLDLLKIGWTPQQARAVLPNSLKTELVMTGFVSDWKHFLELRCDSAAHPQARELAIPLKEEFIKKGYITE